MTETEKKALALVNETASDDEPWVLDDVRGGVVFKTLCRAIEQHEAFRREVSEVCLAVRANYEGLAFPMLDRFIIPQPDPLHECLEEALARTGEDLTEHTERLRAALAARGLEIVKKEPSQ